MKRATVIVIALLAVAIALPATADAKKVRHWHFRTGHHLKDSKTARTTDGDFFSGRVRLIDNFVAASSQRVRNKKHGPRRRAYLVQGTVAIRNQKHYSVRAVTCRNTVGSGSFILKTTSGGARAFFPQPALHIDPVHQNGNIGLAVGPLSVSLPFPAFTQFESSSLAPNVSWASLSSKKHTVVWSWDDGFPNDILLGYTGFWEASAKKLKYSVSCTVITHHDGFSSNPQATVKIKRKSPA